MGTTKTEQFTIEQNKLASMAKAIGHPARIAILEHLFKTEGCVCGDIVDEIDLAQATISQHLKALKDSGLIKGHFELPKIKYCLNKENWNEARQLFKKHMNL